MCLCSACSLGKFALCTTPHMCLCSACSLGKFALCTTPHMCLCSACSLGKFVFCTTPHMCLCVHGHSVSKFCGMHLISPVASIFEQSVMSPLSTNQVTAHVHKQHSAKYQCHMCSSSDRSVKLSYCLLLPHLVKNQR